MHASPRRCFGAFGRRLASSFAQRALAACIISAGLLSAQPTAPSHAHLNPSLAAAGGWLNRFNIWRSSTGLPTLTENSTWSQGDYDHAVYMVKNDLVTHYETAGTPYYTVAGDTAARNSNIYVSSSTATTDEQAIDWWMQAPFHALGMMDPRLTATGFGSYREVKSGWDMGAALDVLRGNSFTGGSYPVYFPGNGTTEPLTSYGGNEYPDPLQACPGYSVPTGLPVFVQVGGNVATTAGAVHSFTGNGVALDHCVIDSHNPAVGSSLTYRGGVILIPRQPLQTGVKYTVALTVNGTPYTWSFTVGPFVSNACTSAGLAADKAAPQPEGTVVTFTASAAGPKCTGPLYEFWTWSSAGGWSLRQPYSANAKFALDTTDMAPGTYSVDAWVEQSGSLFGTAGYETFGLQAWVVKGCDVASLTPNPAPTTGSVQFAATTADCTSPQYEFWMWSLATGWVLERPYSSLNTWNVNVDALPAATYSVDVWVKQSGSPLSYETWALSTIPKGACGTGATTVITPTPLAPQTVGSTVHLSTLSTCGATPSYQYTAFPGQASQWQILRSYNATGAYDWNTTGLKPGTQTLDVGVLKQPPSSSNPAPDTWGLATYSLAGCSAVTLAASPVSPQPLATPVTLAATAVGLCDKPLYQFWVLAPGGQWTMIKDYSSTSTLAWTSSGTPGTYAVVVFVKQQGSGSDSDSFAELSYTTT
jgi:uncharacterized protein YkwD